MKRIDKILSELGLPPEAFPLDELMKVKPTLTKSERGPCGKVKYSSEANAEAAIHGILRKRRGNTSALRSYFCHICNAWNMSSSFHR